MTIKFSVYFFAPGEGGYIFGVFYFQYSFFHDSHSLKSAE